MLGGLLIGVGLLLYPSVANYWNSFHQTQAIMSYNDAVSQMDTQDYKKILDDAKEYNKKLGQSGIQWVMTDAQKAEYQKQLKVDGTEVMGYVSIPKIHVKLPMYHGTEEAVLQTSIGHLEQTSLPVGGKNSHCAGIVHGKGKGRARKLFQVRLHQTDTGIRGTARAGADRDVDCLAG